MIFSKDSNKIYIYFSDYSSTYLSYLIWNGITFTDGKTYIRISISDFTIDKNENIYTVKGIKER